MKKPKRILWSDTDARLRAWLHGCDFGQVPSISERDWRRLVHLMQRLQREASRVPSPKRSPG